MADREGNVLRVPGTGAKAEVKGTEILGSYARFTQKGLTLLKTTGKVWEAGTLLKVSGTAKKYTAVTAADLASATPTVVIVGILRKGVDVSAEDKLANYVVSGVVKGAEVRIDTGVAASAIELGKVAVLLSGRIDPVHNYLIF